MENKEKLKVKLTPQQYEVTQNCGTEPPFSGEYYLNKKDGIYHCVCCGIKLFSSNQKYDSGSGWPSFYDLIDSKNIKKIKDLSIGMERIEIKCANCDAHLGHVFDDGPIDKTGKRYCVNSLSLNFKSKKK